MVMQMLDWAMSWPERQTMGLLTGCDQPRLATDGRTWIWRAPKPGAG